MSCTRYWNLKLKARILSGNEPAWLTRHVRGDYIRQAVLSSAPWADRKAMYALRDEARHRTAETGVYHVLDHVIPLKNDWVCGLTCEANLQVVTYAQNAYKSNRWAPNQMSFDF